MKIKYANLFLYCNSFVLKPSSKIPFKIVHTKSPIIAYVAIRHDIGTKKANNTKKIYSLS